MCIAGWVWKSNPHYPLILVLNRDEFHNRESDAVGWWEWGGQKILGGRDLKAGGTWLGCTENGRLGFLTNFREFGGIPCAKSRGDLPLKFLQSGKSPLEFAEELVCNEADMYSGFNLILSDLRSESMVYVSNRPKGGIVEVVESGIHVLSNAHLNTDWPKAVRLRGKLSGDVVKKYSMDNNKFAAKQMVEEMMMDEVKADIDTVPKNTGHELDWELKLSSIFMETETKTKGRYGTRSQVALSVNKDGEVSLYERYLKANFWQEHTINYRIPN
ncbi:Ser/Thr-rich protein T10 in DGCR region [Zostera marina]|uniref:Ser/Thr-rich protein T10 in DGCR region n=1 Tax=Zostera marina TaxID=29655 RepID=A0A0K9Q582_ZOSMR|nr:Ser/Thr-rich protein T10 in DGCR region [Zostera marina]